ncbi:MAG: translation initiation factor 2 [Pseudomonadota bacterium]
MQECITQSISRAAYQAGLPDGRLIPQTAADNITLARPRLELQFLPATYTESGRAISLRRTKVDELPKREAYIVTQNVVATVFAEHDAWLSAFAYDFIKALPRGFNDSRGNYVTVKAEEATFTRPPDKRVGNSVIKVFNKVETLFTIAYTSRITRDEAVGLIPSVEITTSNMQKI